MKKVHHCSLAYRTRTDVGGLGSVPDDTDRSGTVSASVEFRWTGWDLSGKNTSQHPNRVPNVRQTDGCCSSSKTADMSSLPGMPQTTTS
jgi:hypothetical protein